jgi:tRNA A37 threonylcarbamoyladenosine synthetase subunit TsaC/SUA5/YrdC
MTSSPTVDADLVRQALSGRRAVVLPNPAPLTYVVAATAPHAVNLAKGRPADQAVALWVHHSRTADTVFDALDLGPDLATAARRLLTEERVTLLAPLREHHPLPEWLEPAAKDGWTLLFGARWTPLLPVLREHPVLYVSSANRTGHPPAATASAARAMFPDDVPVLDPACLLDADEERTGTPRAATTTVRLHPDGSLDLHRSGAQDRTHPGAGTYLNHLRTAYRLPDGRTRPAEDHRRTASPRPSGP